MTPGNFDSEIVERSPQTPEKNTSQNLEVNEKIPEKSTAFALHWNSDNSKSYKTTDKKIPRPILHNNLRIKSGTKPESSVSSKENYARNVDRPSGPTVQPRSDGRHYIKPGTISAPLIPGSNILARSFSVTHSKIPLAKKTIKPTLLKNVSDDNKRIRILPAPESTTAKNPSKTSLTSNNATTLKKATTCPPCVKLDHTVKFAQAKTTLRWNLPKSRAGNGSRPRDQTRSLSRETTERKIVKDTSPEKSKHHTKLTEVKRMKSEGDSIVSRSARTSLVGLSTLQPRQATSEIKDFMTNNICLKIATDHETSEKPLDKIPTKLIKTGLKNHVLHVQTPDFVVSKQEVKDEEGKRLDSHENETSTSDNSDPHPKLPGLSSLLPVECYDSFDSIDKKIYDEILSENRNISDHLERNIGQKHDNADSLVGSFDDFGDEFSDIIRQIEFLNEEQQPNIGISQDANRTHTPGTNTARSSDSRAANKLPEKETIKITKECSQQQTNTNPPPAENSQYKNKQTIIDSKREKFPTKGDRSLREKEKRLPEEEKSKNLGQTKDEDSGAEGPSIPSEFFHTHKNVGFIGKEEDEERVSFDPLLVTLYQPRETQMLFYDLANCIATQAYLKMCGINYVLAERKNAENMSPSGKVPFVSSCLCIIPEFEGIVSFMQYKKYSCVRIRECDKAAFRATISLIIDTLEVAERYICWYDQETMITYTKPRIGGLFPFPLNHVIYWRKRYEERKRLALEEMKEESFDGILQKVNHCFIALSQLLGDNKFFFGDACTEIDALVYGHIYAAFTTHEEGLFRNLQFIIKQFPNLITFAVNFDRMFLLHKFSSLNLPPLG